ncbi:TetR family transcriptional regulator, partial [Streptomyces sp. NPDC052109]|uniref:TetR family transcriptional regulator n=1 Tax=Streptomyces sp. NPDC052109 TaxID=3155527 RepID=UPI00341420F4
MRWQALIPPQSSPVRGVRADAAQGGASIASIAGEAGVDRRTVYRRFASREELLAA